MFDDFAVWLREERHLSECTVRTKLVNLNRLRKSCNLWDIEAVRKFIANQSWENNYKSLVARAHSSPIAMSEQSMPMYSQVPPSRRLIGESLKAVFWLIGFVVAFVEGAIIFRILLP